MKRSSLVGGVIITATILFTMNKAMSADHYQTFVVPDDVMEKYFSLPIEKQQKSCKARNFVFDKLPVLAQDPPQRIKGYNSRMDNPGLTEGAKETDKYTLRMSEALTGIISSNDESQKEIVLESLYQWAKAKALSKTKNCIRSDGSWGCDGWWSDKKGQNKYAGHDFNTAQLSIMHLAYGYYFSLASFNPQDPRHEVIKDWFNMFFKRNKKAEQMYAGHDSSYHWPEFMESIVNGKEPSVRKIKRLIEFQNDQINDDGSIQKRTTRGNKSLWYHYATLNEIVVNMEIARRYGVDIPKGMDEKIVKSANIFFDGFNDFSYMDKWAKEAYSGVYEPGVQHFNLDIRRVPNGTVWMYVMQYRYPNTDIANRIAKFVDDKELNNQAADGITGVGYGCIYKAIL